MRRHRDEAGFTLVELLLAIAILGIVIAPLAGGIIVGLRTMDRTSSRYSASNDAQVLSRRLPPDVQSANTGRVSTFTNCAGTGNRKLQLTGNAGGAGGARIVMYWVRTASGGGFELVRSVWENANCTGTAQTSVVARDIASASNVTATQLSGTPLGFKIRVTEGSPPGAYTFTVSARKRTTVS